MTLMLNHEGKDYVVLGANFNLENEHNIGGRLFSGGGIPIVPAPMVEGLNEETGLKEKLEAWAASQQGNPPVFYAYSSGINHTSPGERSVAIWKFEGFDLQWSVKLGPQEIPGTDIEWFPEIIISEEDDIFIVMHGFIASETLSIYRSDEPCCKWRKTHTGNLLVGHQDLIPIAFQPDLKAIVYVDKEDGSVAWFKTVNQIVEDCAALGPNAAAKLLPFQGISGLSSGYVTILGFSSTKDGVCLQIRTDNPISEVMLVHLNRDQEYQSKVVRTDNTGDGSGFYPARPWMGEQGAYITNMWCPSRIAIRDIWRPDGAPLWDGFSPLPDNQSRLHIYSADSSGVTLIHSEEILNPDWHSISPGSVRLRYDEGTLELPGNLSPNVLLRDKDGNDITPQDPWWNDIHSQGYMVVRTSDPKDPLGGDGPYSDMTWMMLRDPPNSPNDRERILILTTNNEGDWKILYRMSVSYDDFGLQYCSPHGDWEILAHNWTDESRIPGNNYAVTFGDIRHGVMWGGLQLKDSIPNVTTGQFSNSYNDEQNPLKATGIAHKSLPDIRGTFHTFAGKS